MTKERATQAIPQQQGRCVDHKLEYNSTGSASIVNVLQSRWAAQLQASPRVAAQRRQIAASFGLSAESQMQAIHSLGPHLLTPKTNVVQRSLKRFENIQYDAKTNKFQWGKLRTDPDDHNPKHKAIARGLKVKLTRDVKETGGDKELETKISWDPVHDESGEGTKVDALIGPDHELGSEPQSGNHIWNVRRNMLAAMAKKEYRAGHLLNNNLGGPGNDARNLTAVPATINSLQSSHVEREVIKLVNSNYRFIHYKVEVSYTSSKDNRYHYASKINSEWCAVNKDGEDIKPWKSVALFIPEPGDKEPEKTIEESENRKEELPKGAEAAVNPAKELVLSNEAYLKVAFEVQGIFREIIRQHEEEVTKLAGELSNANKALEDSAKTIDQLTQKLTDAVENNRQTARDEIHAELVSTKVKYNELLLKYNDAIEEIESISDQLERARQTLRETENALAENQRRLKAQHEYNNIIVQENEKLINSNNKISEKNTELTNENTKLLDENKALTAENTYIKQEYDRATEIANQLREELSNSEGKNQITKDKYRKLKDDYEKLKTAHNIQIDTSDMLKGKIMRGKVQKDGKVLISPVKNSERTSLKNN